jgi:hypothetical protein
LLFGVLLLVACGNSDSQTPVATAGASSGDAGPTQAPPETASGDANTSPVNSLDACDSFGLLGGLVAGFSAQTAGVNMETSGTPGSELAEDVRDFAVESLQEALEGDVSAGCFMEFSSDGETGVWIALTLPDAIASGAADRVSDAMTERGASVTGAMSSASQGATFDLVSFDALPFEAPNDADLQGAVYFVANTDGAYMAVVIASYSDDSSSDDSSPSDGTPSDGGSQVEEYTPGPTEPPVAVVPSGLAETINDGLEPALEDALGIGLVVESFFQMGSEGSNAITLSYAFEEPLPSSVDGASALTRAIEELGGSVTFSMSAAEGTTAAFEKVEIGGLTLSGTLTMAENSIAALVSNEG